MVAQFFEVFKKKKPFRTEKVYHLIMATVAKTHFAQGVINATIVTEPSNREVAELNLPEQSLKSVFFS